MTSARSLVLTDTEAYYHCVSRCVRRAYLYGYDSLTGKNYNHRKYWIKNRLKLLLKVFTMDILACGLMDNHLHLLLRTRPDLLEKLSNREIMERWLELYPPRNEQAREEALRTQDEKRLAKLRSRLGNISWFMKSLNEYLARRANKEDECKGRFWEGRFKSQRVKGEASILSCAVYIDLNPVRAGKAKTPEESEHTSAYERIWALKRCKDKSREPDLWFSPVQDIGERRGFLSITLSEYLQLLDATGRELKAGKRGRIPEHLEPILTRVGIKPEGWLSATTGIEKNFSSFISDGQSILETAASLGKKWLKGLSVAKTAFT